MTHVVPAECEPWRTAPDPCRSLAAAHARCVYMKGRLAGDSGASAIMITLNDVASISPPAHVYAETWPSVSGVWDDMASVAAFSSYGVRTIGSQTG